MRSLHLTPVRPCHPGGLGPSPKAREARQKHKSSFVVTYHSLFSNQQLKIDMEDQMIEIAMKHRSFSFGEGEGG